MDSRIEANPGDGLRARNGRRADPVPTGHGICFTLASGSCFNSADVETPFTVTNGAFDVGILAAPITSGARLSDHP